MKLSDSNQQYLITFRCLLFQPSANNSPNYVTVDWHACELDSKVVLKAYLVCWNLCQTSANAADHSGTALTSRRSSISVCDILSGSTAATCLDIACDVSDEHPYPTWNTVRVSPDMTTCKLIGLPPAQVSEVSWCQNPIITLGIFLSLKVCWIHYLVCPYMWYPIAVHCPVAVHGPLRLLGTVVTSHTAPHRQACTPVMSMVQKAVQSTHCTSCNQPAETHVIMLCAVKCSLYVVGQF